MRERKFIKWFEDLTSDDAAQVGGKNASLGEMIRNLKEKGINVPEGYATTSEAYREYIRYNDLESSVRDQLKKYQDEKVSLEEAGESIRKLLLDGKFPEELKEQIQSSYQELCEKYGQDNLLCAVRSSATAEDLPHASFAGQQESFLNVSGEDDIVDACKKCYASLFTDRAIIYREEQGFDHMKVALSAGIHKMIGSDSHAAGVMFSIDTETGFPDAAVINGAWGLGEAVVQGSVKPYEYRVFKPLLDDENLKPILSKKPGPQEKKLRFVSWDSEETERVDTTEEERSKPVLSDEDVLTLARWARAIEEHYNRPMDIEWVKEMQPEEKLFIVQARPETVQSQRKAKALHTYTLKEKGKSILEGTAIGSAVAFGKAQVLKSPDESDRFERGSVLITTMTDPDWVPIMEQASAIVTDEGGRTSHAAIVSRELGVPAVVGTGGGTETVEDGTEVTVSCAEGETGKIYEGRLEYEEKELDLSDVPKTKTKILMNMASPSAAFRWWNLPAEGIGLARMEFIVNNIIKIHPLALSRYEDLEDEKAKKRIEELTSGWENKEDYFVDHLARGLAQIAASQYPDKVIVRMSDFKTNEYADLIGGCGFEPYEENPMLGFRGAARYYSDKYRDGFALECRAVKTARSELGLKNIIIMIPFCRTLEEADKILKLLAENGLERKQDNLEIYVMAEIPSNIILAEEFAERFDGFSIGTNDLTQLVLGIGRDSAELAHLYDERNPAVKRMVRDLIERAHSADTPVGICGQAP
ncbi:MAG: phosphoenolpyruvate synthase, partial [Spirochaetota bacterium]